MTARTRVLLVGADVARKGGRDLIEAWRDGGFARSADLEIVSDDPAVPAGLPGIQVLRDAHPDDYRRRLAHIIHASHRPSVNRVE